MEKCIRKFRTQCAMTLTGVSCVPKCPINAETHCIHCELRLFETENSGSQADRVNEVRALL